MNKIITLLTIGTVSVFAQITPSELMTKVYGKYDSKAKCWHNKEYCMEIDSSKVLNCDTGKRLYLMATGDNDIGHIHVSSGSVGAFVVEEQNGKDVIIAQNKNMEMGSYGQAPREWKLVKLAPSDYWGWINQDGYGNQGYYNSWYSILAPYGKTIKYLGEIMSNQSDSAVSGNPTIDLDSKFKIDDSNKNVKIYPLLITVSGINNGNNIKPIQYTINFDFNKWQYIVPSNYIIKGF
ncbi:MAG: hypothetical protein FNT15_04120 [Sulfurovum sp.]|jgi:hypothetical protein|nr:MAG: hypothetical protein FNT15_04120 [Sulfurovum sp.]